MNTLLLLVVSLASMSLCRAGSRGNWASGATVDRDPAAPAPSPQSPQDSAVTPPSPYLQPPKGPEESEAPKAPRTVAYAQAGRPASPATAQGPDVVQGARATATGDRPTTATHSARRGNTKFSIATATTTNGDVHTAALA